MKRKLGEILVDSGAVAPSDIAAALADQSAGEPARLGDLLVSLGKITPTQLGQALAVQHGIPYVELPRIPQTVLQSVPLLFQQQHRLVPFALEGDTLSLAVVDPSEANGLGAMLKRKIKVHIAAGDEIDAIHAIAADASLARASPPPGRASPPTAAELFDTVDTDPGPSSDLDEIFSELEGSPPVAAPAQPSPPPIAPVAPPRSPPAPKRPAGSSDLFAMLAEPPPQPLGAPWESKPKAVPLGTEPESPSGLWDVPVEGSSDSVAANAAAAQSPMEELEVLSGIQEVEPPSPTAPHARQISTKMATAVTPVPPARAVAVAEQWRVEVEHGASPSGMFELKDVPERPLPDSSLDSLVITPDVPVKAPPAVPSPAPAARPGSKVTETRAEGARKTQKVERAPDKPARPEKPEKSEPKTAPAADLDLPEWLRDATKGAGPERVEAVAKAAGLWTGALDDVAPSKLIVSAVRALVERGVLTERELLELVGKK